MNILYEDNHILAVVKPPNLPVQADASGDDDLLSQCKRYIKEKYNKPGEVYLGLVHRLDRPVGGVMVFARTSKAASRLSSQFKSHSTVKKYAALTQGEPLPRARLEDLLLSAEDGSLPSRVKGASARVVPEGTQGAKQAVLSYVLAASEGGLSLLDVTLFTGRHHQIRAQLSAHKAPIYGDQRYNPDAVPGEQLALWAYSLSFEHPTLHSRLRLSSLPSGGAWQPFEEKLSAMEKDIYISYEDENIIAVIKPANLETAQCDAAPGKDSLESRVSSLCASPVYPVHRLDANTTGLVLFAKNTEAEKALGEAISKRRINKFYRCVVKNEPRPPKATLKAWLLKDAKAARVTISETQQNGSKNIETAYETLSPSALAANAYELEVELLTGRTHQIRAHLAYAGHPLLGDDKYGERDWNRENKARALYLCACRISFSLPPDDPLCYLNEKTFTATPFWAE